MPIIYDLVFIASSIVVHILEKFSGGMPRCGIDKAAITIIMIGDGK